MLLTPSIAWLLFSAALVLFLYLLDRILKRTSLQKKQIRPLIIFFLALSLPFVFHFTNSSVYVVNSKTDHQTYFIYGKVNFYFRNGANGSFNWSSPYTIVNNYHRPLEYKKMVYTSRYSIEFGKNVPMDIEPFSATVIPDEISFFPDEIAPKTVRIGSSVQEVTRYWLYESDQGHYAGNSTSTEAVERKNFTEFFVDSMLNIKEFTERMEQIKSYYAPFKIVVEDGIAFMIFLAKTENSLKKIPLDTLLVSNKKMYEFSTYNLFKYPGKPILTDYYFNSKKTIELEGVTLDVDIKDTKATAFFINNSYDKRLSQAIVKVIVLEDQDTIANETATINMNIPPRTFQSIGFILSSLKHKSFQKKNMFFNYSYEMEDYTIK